jgi:hypothetical protein
VLCTVTGYDVNGNIVTTDKWERAQFSNEKWTEICGATCVGKSYVYRIRIHQLEELNDQNQWVHGSGHIITLTGDSQYSIPSSGFNATHFRYMGQTEKDLFCGSYPGTNSALNVNTPAHHDMWSGCPFDYTEPNFKQITNINNDHNINDINMNRLTGTVYRTPKAMGIWNTEGNTTSDVLTGQAQSVCGQYVNSIVGLTNYANNVLTLENNIFCNGFYSAGVTIPNEDWGPGSDSDLPDGGNDIDLVYDWLMNFGYNFFNYHTSGGTIKPTNPTIFSELERISGGYGIDGFDNTTGIPWWPSDSIIMMNFFKLDVSNPTEDNSIAKMSFRKDSLFSPNGSPVSTNFTLEKGLYEIDLMLKGGVSIPLIYEVQEKTTQSYALSNYLSINIFPVPINKDGSYSVNFDAKATLKFDYIVYDEFGKKQFERKFVMHQGHERTVKIRDNKLPSGILFHKFVFEDNSEINITTIKE